MKKLNKKGFTLIEMLVVIAIIAILVSIIVPVVGNSTVKASAATNAANLRSVAAEVSIKHLEDPVTIPAGTYEAAAKGTFTQTKDGAGNAVSGTPATIDVTAPAAKSVAAKWVGEGTGTDVAITNTAKLIVVIDEEGVTATYDSVTLETFANIAEDGKNN